MPGGIDDNYQKLITGSVTAVSQSIDLTSPNQSTEIIQIQGTWIGTMIIEGSNDGINYYPLTVIAASSGLTITNITTTGIYTANTNGFSAIRIRSTAWSSGTAAISSWGSDSSSLNTNISLLRGATDGTQIGNISDRLKVDANLTSGQLVPTITNKFRIRHNIGDITLPSGSPGSLVTLYTRSGTGLFFGFQAEFDGSNVEIRLTLDAGQVFSLILDDVRQFQFNDTTTTRTQMGGFLTTIGNVLDFSSKFAIPYSTSVLIEARVSSGGARKNKNWIAFLTEDT